MASLVEMLGQQSHGVVKGTLEVDFIGVGKCQDTPQTIGKFVRQCGVEVLAWAYARLALNKLGKVSNVTDESEHDFLGGPGTPMTSGIPVGVLGANPSRCGSHLLKVHLAILGYRRRPSHPARLPIAPRREGESP